MEGCAQQERSAGGSVSTDWTSVYFTASFGLPAWLAHFFRFQARALTAAAFSAGAQHILSQPVERILMHA